MNINSVQFAGRLGADPKVNKTDGKGLMVVFNLASSRVYKDSSGERKEETTWMPCVAYDKVVEGVLPYLTKGTLIYVEGSLNQREYEVDGQKRNSVQIRVRNIQLFPKGSSGGDSGGGGGAAAKPAPVKSGDSFDDVPF